MGHLRECLLVGAGGATGSILRYLLTLLPVYTAFPLMTLLINVLAALAMGFFTALFAASVSSDLSLLLRVGFCGGFSTLSALSLEVVELGEMHHLLLACFYMFGTMLLCLIGIWLGELLAGWLLAA